MKIYNYNFISYVVGMYEKIVVVTVSIEETVSLNPL